MNALGRLLFNFSSGGIQAGWSENYFFNAASYSAAATALDAIFTQRIALLSSDCSLVGTLISDTDVKGDSYPSGLSTPQAGTWASAGTDPTGNIALAVRWKGFAGAFKRGSRFLHGVPKSQIAAGGFYVPTTPFTTALNAYFTAVQTQSQLGTRIKGAVAPPFYTLTPYTAFALEGMEKRNIGRPFFLYRGRRLIA